MENIILKKNGEPFKIKAPAVAKAQRLGMDYEVVEVEGGYGIRQKEYPEPKDSVEDMMKVGYKPDEEIHMEEVQPTPKPEPETPPPAEEVIQAAAIHVKDDGEVRFFSEVDKGSQVPGWYYEHKVEELADSVRMDERKIEMGLILPHNIMHFKEKLRQKKEKLEKLRESKPRLTARQKDTIAKEAEYLGEKIRESMLSHDDMKKMWAGPRDELKRRKTPYIKFKGKMLNRDQACWEWKLRRKLLGEVTNTEILRPRNELAPGVVRLSQHKIEDYI